MVLLITFATLAVSSVLLLAWQAVAASRFPLHRREGNTSFAPPVALLKPLQGRDEHTLDCLRSWLAQDYAGPVKILFGVADAADPACDLVRALLKEFPNADAELVLTPEPLGANGKVANLAQLHRHLVVRHSSFLVPQTLLCLSDADVRVPRDFLAHAVAPLRDEGTGLVTSFYRLANPSTFAMCVEAVAINADFWSQVLQSNTLKPQDFALGAVMITRPAQLEAAGGFAALAGYLADDYQLGHRIAKNGARIALTPLVVECWDAPMNFRAVWGHQLRWARTIRASQPAPYFFSILNNVTLWTTAFALVAATRGVIHVGPGFPWHINPVWMLQCLLVWLLCVATRVVTARHLARRSADTLSALRSPDGGLAGLRESAAVLVKDFMQAGVWAGAFLGNTVTWRGRTFRVQRGGRLVEQQPVAERPAAPAEPPPTSSLPG